VRHRGPGGGLLCECQVDYTRWGTKPPYSPSSYPYPPSSYSYPSYSHSPIASRVLFRHQQEGEVHCRFGLQVVCLHQTAAIWLL